MGLSERKVKQRIGDDPRNLTWSDDKSRFSYKHMTSLGWSEHSGIGGSNLSGNPNHIAVARKLDNGGIGMARALKEGDELASGAGRAGQGLEDVLKRLAEAATNAVEASSDADVKVEIKVEASKPIRNRIASRQRHLHSKRLASSSPAALAEILGVPISSLPSTPRPASPSPLASGMSTPRLLETATETPTTSSDSTPEPERTAEETVSTSKMSVSDYFRQKLREKTLARQAASGSSTPVVELSENSLARVKDEIKVPVGGVAWEGSRMTFGETKIEPESLGESSASASASGSGSNSGLVTPVENSKETPEERAAKKAAKKAKKADKEARKAAKEAEKAARSESTSTPRVGSTSVDVLSEKDEKKRRKEEKRAKKEAEKAAFAGSGGAVSDGPIAKKRKREDENEESAKEEGKTKSKSRSKK